MGRISGVLFFQGETDALDPLQYPVPEPNAFLWADLFTTFIFDLRTDLADPNLPVIFAQLGEITAPEAFTNWDVVKDQQLSIELPMTAMIMTDDLPLLDGLHFSTESYRIIGERFAKAYWDLAEEKSGKSRALLCASAIRCLKAILYSQYCTRCKSDSSFSVCESNMCSRGISLDLGACAYTGRNL